MKIDAYTIPWLILIIFLLGVIAGIVLDETLSREEINTLADSIALAKIDSLIPTLRRSVQDWDVLHSQVQFHAMLHRRFYSGKSDWHKTVRRELDEARQYWQPKNKEVK